MDPIRFDILARSLTTGSSRRATLAGLLAGVVSVLGWSAAQDAAAKSCKKIKDKKKRKKCLKKAKDGKPCIAACAGKLCGDDGCGGLCGLVCSGGKTCQSGACACPSDMPLECPGRCAECCGNLDCNLGEDCVQGQCIVTSSTCPTGADNCADGFITPCRSDGSCVCVVSATNETHCASNVNLNTGCNSCTDNAECVALRPEIPGIFCAKGGSPCCMGFCVAPCPS